MIVIIVENVLVGEGVKQSSQLKFSGSCWIKWLKSIHGNINPYNMRRIRGWTTDFRNKSPPRICPFFFMIAFVSCNGNLVPCLRVYVVQIHVDLSSRFFELLPEFSPSYFQPRIFTHLFSPTCFHQPVFTQSRWKVTLFSPPCFHPSGCKSEIVTP